MRRPNEYAGLAVCAALYGAVLAYSFYASGPPATARDAAVRAVATGLCALAWVSAEAIWRVRPWAYSAALALAVGTVGLIAVPALWAMVLGNVLGALEGLLMAGCIALVLAPMLRYLRRSAPQALPRP